MTTTTLATGPLVRRHVSRSLKPWTQWTAYGHVISVAVDRWVGLTVLLRVAHCPCLPVQIDVPTLDLTTLKRIVLKLERAISKNQQMRIKYSDEPDKYGNARVRVPALERLFTQCADWTGHLTCLAGLWSPRWTWTRT